MADKNVTLLPKKSVFLLYFQKWTYQQKFKWDANHIHVGQQNASETLGEFLLF